MKKYNPDGSRFVSVSYMERRKKRIPVYEVNHDDYDPRPKTFGECMDVPGPCPWVSCRHNLYLDVASSTGSITINFKNKEPWEMKDSCALKVAGEGEMTLISVGQLLNVSRERARQLETKALENLRSAIERRDRE